MATEHRTHNQTAPERREAVIDAAITEFAERGLHGTATEDIARRAGISQPYIFRLFGTKKDLFLAAANRVCDRITAMFEQAASQAEADGVDVLEAMGTSFYQLIADREELLMMLHSFAAGADLEVQAVVRTRYEDLFEWVKRRAGIDGPAARGFFATGMLMSVARAMDAPRILGVPDWETLGRAGCPRMGITYPSTESE